MDKKKNSEYEKTKQKKKLIWEKNKTDFIGP